MSTGMHIVLLTLLVLGATIWMGGLAAMPVIVRAATSTLPPEQRVPLFRAIGRGFLPVATSALVLVLAAGGLLLADRPWDGRSTSVVVLAAALVVVTAAGVVQARRMTRLRHRALAAEQQATPDFALTAAVRRGSVTAAAVRGGIGLLSVALLVVVVTMAG